MDGVQITGDPATAAKAGYTITAELTKNGVLVRPYGNTIVFGPALSTAREEVDEILERIGATLERLQK